jgi:hypothetical protein
MPSTYENKKSVYFLGAYKIVSNACEKKEFFLRTNARKAGGAGEN